MRRFPLRFYSTLDSLNLNLASSASIRIASLLPPEGGFKMSDGSVHTGPLALIGQNRLQWRPTVQNQHLSSSSLAQSLEILGALRPLPDVVVIGAGRTPAINELREAISKSPLVTKFGLSFEIMDTVI